MGMIDRYRAAARQVAREDAADATQKQLAAEIHYRDQLAQVAAPGTELARRDHVRYSDDFRLDTPTAYIAALGLRPEDVYGIVPQTWGPGGADQNGIFFYSVIYRDRPEYAAGRQRWAEHQGGLATVHQYPSDLSKYTEPQ